jgi:UDP-N-acetylmuramoyl-L-alanyl-D-glutamate--2,6-diaminopimelate ligase
VQHRVSALPFAAAVFTNLSRDHLDYHHTMQAYADAKRQIFQQTAAEHCILNADDETAYNWLLQMPQAVVYGIDRQLPAHPGLFVYATEVKYHPQGITISIHSSWGDGVLSAPLLGKFNVSNLLAALAVMLVLQYDFETLCQTAAHLQPVTGRMECFGNQQQPLVVVDYAHTPDGLEKALQAARQHCYGRLFCIFGCGGDRDRGKRPQMAAIAEQWADTIILTDDNPRTEDPTRCIGNRRRPMTVTFAGWLRRFHAELTVAHTPLMLDEGGESLQVTLVGYVDARLSERLAFLLGTLYGFGKVEVDASLVRIHAVIVVYGQAVAFLHVSLGAGAERGGAKP